MTGIGSVINIAEVQAGDSVAVVGCGGVGLNVIQGARLAGAGRIIAIDTRAAPLERARAFGATDVVQAAIDDPRHEALVARTRAVTGGSGDRKGVVWGKSVAVRVEFGGRRIIKKKKKEQNHSLLCNTNIISRNATINDAAHLEHTDASHKRQKNKPSTRSEE